MKKKTILITGATSGIGKATALMLAEKNSVIIAVGQNKKRLKLLKKKITETEGVCHTYTSDLSQIEKIKNLYKKINKDFKSIDWIIHSAGYINKNEQTNKTSLIKTFNVNLFSFIDLTNLFFKKIKSGTIAISSTAGIWGSTSYPIYAASKSALNNYSQSIAKQNKYSSIVICPGPTNTPMRQKVAKDASSHQSPEVIALVIEKIVYKNKYKNGDIILARNKKVNLFKGLN